MTVPTSMHAAILVPPDWVATDPLSCVVAFLPADLAKACIQAQQVKTPLLILNPGSSRPILPAVQRCLALLPGWKREAIDGIALKHTVEIEKALLLTRQEARRLTTEEKDE
jgi:hypothetical protein